RAPPRAAGARCHARPERCAAGARVRVGGARDLARAHQAGRHRARWRRAGDRRRAEAADQRGGPGRGAGRLGAVRRGGIRARVVRVSVERAPAPALRGPREVTLDQIPRWMRWVIPGFAELMFFGLLLTLTEPRMYSD